MQQSSSQHVLSRSSYTAYFLQLIFYMRLLLALPLCIFPLQSFLNAFFLLTLHTRICRMSSYRLPCYFAILMLLCERSNLVVI